MTAAISTQPDVSAFLAGFELAIGIGFTLVVALVGLSILRRMLGV